MNIKSFAGLGIYLLALPLLEDDLPVAFAILSFTEFAVDLEVGDSGQQKTSPRVRWRASKLGAGERSRAVAGAETDPSGRSQGGEPKSHLSCEALQREILAVQNRVWAWYHCLLDKEKPSLKWQTSCQPNAISWGTPSSSVPSKALPRSAERQLLSRHKAKNR